MYHNAPKNHLNSFARNHFQEIKNMVNPTGPGRLATETKICAFTTLEYRIEDPGRLLFFSPNANRVVDLKQSRLLFFSKYVHRVAIKQSRLLNLLYSFFPKMYTESYIPSESFIFSSIFANRVVYSMRVLYLIL